MKNGLIREWTLEQKRRLAAVCFPLIEMQNQYGQRRDPKIVMKGWEIMLAGRYEIEQIIWAVLQFVDKNPGFPTVSDINKILNPEPPEVTQTEYIAALDFQKRNNWPIMSDAQETIDAYRAQSRKKTNSYAEQKEAIKTIVLAHSETPQLTYEDEENEPV